MYVSFGRRLRALGRVKVGASFRLNGPMGWSLILVVALLRLYWYLMLGVLWMLYGIVYLCFVLPLRGIARLCKKRKTQ